MYAHHTLPSNSPARQYDWNLFLGFDQNIKEVVLQKNVETKEHKAITLYSHYAFVCYHLSFYCTIYFYNLPSKIQRSICVILESVHFILHTVTSDTYVYLFSSSTGFDCSQDISNVREEKTKKTHMISHNRKGFSGSLVSRVSTFYI